MKKIYVLMAMLFGLFGSNAFAQDAYDLGFTVDLTALSNADGYTVDDQSPLITDVWEQLYGEEGELNPCTDLGEGSEWALLGETKPDEVTNRNSQDFWHSNWHNNAQPVGSHYLQVMMTDDLDPDDLIMFAFTRRNVDNDHTTLWLVMGTDDPEATKDECEEIAEIQTPFSSTTETLLSTPFKRGEYQYLRFYSEEQKGNNSDYYNRGYFHMSRFNIFPAVKLEETDVAWNKATKLYDDYSAAYDSFYGRTGTDPGDYSEEAVQAFLDAYDAYDNLNNATAAQILEWCDQLVAAYDAIAPTKVPFTAKNLANGYYRIKGGMLYTNDDEDVEKYMVGTRNDGKLWGEWMTPDLDDEKESIQALWKITAVTDTTFDVQNMYHKGRFLPVTRSENVEMSLESDSLLAFDAVATNHDEEPPISYVNIRLAGQEANGFVYLHQNNHNNGSGVSGNLVGWCTTWGDGPKASEWYFEKVDDAEAQAIINSFNDEEDIWRADYINILKQAPDMIEVTKDVATVNLITDAAQMSSPFSQNDLGGGDGGNLSDGVLIDGKTNTYWHSVWSASEGNVVPEGRHYLQVELPEDLNAEQQIYMRFTRRDTNNNQITNWSFEGTNDPEAVDGECEVLATFESPWHSSNQTESYKSDPFDTKSYKYIRFYNDQNNAGSAFFHLSEIQLCYDVENPKSQYVALGDVAKNFEDAYEEFKDVDAADATKEDYDKLKAAYDAFVARYVNPQDLRDTIALAENQLESVVEGTNPGFYPVGISSALKNLISNAKTYDEAGAYTKAQSSEFLASMKEQMATIEASPIKIQEGKWYRFRFGTEEEYDKYKWNKSGNYPNYYIVDEDTVGVYNYGNFGKYIAVANRRNEVLGLNDAGDDVNGSVIEPIAKEDVMFEKSIHGIDLAALTDQDMALWRFVSIGDSAYAIQNKATGLYINNGGSLSVQPGLFTQHPSGYGQNAFFNKSLEGKTHSPLHLAQSQTVLCAWGNESGTGWTDADGRRGSFFVEEVENVAADFPTSGILQMSLTPGDIYGRCLPVPLTLQTPDVAKLWTVDYIERTADAEDAAVETVKVTFAQIASNQVVAGRPFFIVADGEMPGEGEEYDPLIAKFAFTFDLVNKPQTSGYLKGVFDSKEIPVRFLTTGTGHEDEALTWKSAKESVSGNRVYITDIAEGSEGFLRKATFEIAFTDLPDGINTAIKNVSRIGGIYTIDGRFVQNGNINSISNLPKGAYIINGTKVIVK